MKTETRFVKRRTWFAMPGLVAGLLVSGVAGAQDTTETVDYADSNNWLCLPDYPRACGVDLSTTIVNADGSTRLTPWSGNPNARIDCFYVYPTVSQDATPNSDLVAGPEEFNVVRSQFARLGSECRTFAPLYRQVTLTALRAGMGGGEGMAPDRDMPYQDVLNAWNYYLEKHNNGRGVVLVGHSQGSGVLTRLISNEIEGKDIQEQIISALLIGTNVQVPDGELVGGTFEHMPLCERGDQIGCVIAYASFRDTIPPPATGMFGRGGNDTVAACTNPAQLAKGSNELDAYLSNAGAEGISSATPAPWTSIGASVTTPFVNVPGMLTGECVNKNGFSYLEVTVHSNPDDNRIGDITGDVLNADGSVNSGWGLHVIDVNLAMGDLVTIVGRQARSYLLP